MARPKEFEYTEALDKAVTVFWEKGYEATSIQDLVDQMGINRGSLYDTFGSKESLFLTILDRYGQIVVEKLLAILKENQSPKASIKHFFMAIVDHIVTAGPLRGCLITNSAVSTALDNPLVAKKVELILSHIEESFYKSLLHAQQLGEISSEKDIRGLARYFTSNLQGLLVMGKVRPERSWLTDMVSTHLAILD